MGGLLIIAIIIAAGILDHQVRKENSIPDKLFLDYKERREISKRFKSRDAS